MLIFSVKDLGQVIILRFKDKFLGYVLRLWLILRIKIKIKANLWSTSQFK
jgi:hypothetical protein